MSKQWFLGRMLTIALLFSLSMAACIQPMPAPGTKAAAIVAGATDNVIEVNKAAMRGWVAAFNSHDLAGLDQAVDKYYATDYTLHDPTVPNFMGGAATIKKLVRESMLALPDFHATIEQMSAEGDMLAVRLTVTGTQPDGKPLHFFTMSMLRFVNGQMAEEWELAEATGEEVIGSDISQ